MMAVWQPRGFVCTCSSSRHAPQVLGQLHQAGFYTMHTATATRHAPQAAPSRSFVATRAAPGAAAPADSAQQSRTPLPPLSDQVYEEGAFVQVGTVSGVFGIKGELRVEIATDQPKARFAAGKTVFLRPPVSTGLLGRAQGSVAPPMLQLTCASAKVRYLPKGEEAWLVNFKELADRGQSEQLVEYTLWIGVTERDELQDADEFYVQDLVGCRVFRKSDSLFVGKVMDVIDGTGTHDTLLVQLALTKEDVRNSQIRQCMIPFVKAIVPLVNFEQQQMVIDPPEGLLGLFSLKDMKRKLTEEQIRERIHKLQTGPRPTLGSTVGDMGLDVMAEGPGSTSNSTTPRTAKSSVSAAPTKRKSLFSESKSRSSSPDTTSTPSSSKPRQGKEAATEPPRAQQRLEQKAKGGKEQQGSGSRGQVLQDVVSSQEVFSPEAQVQDKHGKADESSTPPGTLERWQLRRKLGVSLGSKLKRRPGGA